MPHAQVQWTLPRDTSPLTLADSFLRRSCLSEASTHDTYASIILILLLLSLCSLNSAIRLKKHPGNLSASFGSPPLTTMHWPQSIFVDAGEEDILDILSISSDSMSQQNCNLGRIMQLRSRCINSSLNPKRTSTQPSKYLPVVPSHLPPDMILKMTAGC